MCPLNSLFPKMFLGAFHLPDHILSADDTFMNKTKYKKLFFGDYILVLGEKKNQQTSVNMSGGEMCYNEK